MVCYVFFKWIETGDGDRRDRAGAREDRDRERRGRRDERRSRRQKGDKVGAEGDADMVAAPAAAAAGEDYLQQSRRSRSRSPRGGIIRAQLSPAPGAAGVPGGGHAAAAETAAVLVDSHGSGPADKKAAFLTPNPNYLRSLYHG